MLNAFGELSNCGIVGGGDSDGGTADGDSPNRSVEGSCRRRNQNTINVPEKVSLAALGRVATFGGLEPAVEKANVVIEAVPEARLCAESDVFGLLVTNQNTVEGVDAFHDCLEPEFEGSNS